MHAIKLNAWCKDGVLMSAFTTRHKLSIINYSKLNIHVISAVLKGKKRFAVKFNVFCQFLLERVSGARRRLSNFFFKYQEKPVKKASGIKLVYFEKDFLTLAAFERLNLNAETRNGKHQRKM